MKKEFNMVMGILSLLFFFSAHFLYPRIGRVKFVFMGFNVGNFIVDIFFGLAIIFQIYIIIMLGKK